MVTTHSRKKAFTLIELLVVVSIILIATSILFIGGGGGGDGVKLSSAQRIVSSIAQAARGQALLKSATTRLIIYSEANTAGDPDKLLRYFGVVYLQEDDPDTPDDESGWVAASQGDYLPEGIYFDHITSSTIGTPSWPKSQATMRIQYPRQSAQAEGTGEEYYFYEFNSNGTVPTDFINTWLVLRAGILKPGAADTLEVDIEDPTLENLKAALIFRRVGSTTLVTDFGDAVGGNN